MKQEFELSTPFDVKWSLLFPNAHTVLVKEEMMQHSGKPIPCPDLSEKCSQWVMAEWHNFQSSYLTCCLCIIFN